MVKTDSKGRVTLGSLAKGVNSFSVKKYKGNRIVLEPYTKIPFREKWLFENKIALNKVQKGIKDAVLSRVSEIGSFAKYSDDEIE